MLSISNNRLCNNSKEAVISWGLCDAGVVCSLLNMLATDGSLSTICMIHVRIEEKNCSL